MSRFGAILVSAGVTLALSGCVTARFHSEEEINTVGRECGLAHGELFQDAGEKRLLFLFKIDPTVQQRVCVARWARKNKLKTVFINAINFPES